MTAVPFMSARPSFGAKASGFSPAFRKAADDAIIAPAWLARRFPVIVAATYDRGVRSPLAPTEPSEGMRGRTSRLSMPTRRSSSSGRTPE